MARNLLRTCHFFSSVTQGYKGIVDEYDHSNSTKPDFYTDKYGQRKLLEMVYLERALSEMRKSVDEILAAFKKELETAGVQRDQESYELIYAESSFPLKAGTVLGDLLQQLDSSITVIEQWEKREDSRGYRSRWSQKDQDRHGEKLRTSALKCKSNVQQLRVQQNRLKELRRVSSIQCYYSFYRNFLRRFFCTT